MRLFLISLLSVLLCSCATRSFVRDEIRKAVHSQQSTVDSFEERLEAVEIESGRALAIADHVLWKVSITRYEVFSEEEIHFNFDEYSLSETSIKILDETGERLVSQPEFKLTIEGHTCRIGSEKYNLDLGRNRAEEAQRYLVVRWGISLHRISCITFGESRDSGLGAEDRRVILRLWQPEERQ